MPQRKLIAAPESFQTFGDLLVYLRKRARLTQEELGRAVGYSRPQITLLEKKPALAFRHNGDGPIRAGARSG
jgi:hypothetical protein